MLHEYDKIIQEQLGNNIVEKAPDSSVLNEWNEKAVNCSPHYMLWSDASVMQHRCESYTIDLT